ncbi:MAG: lytic transglycosylase domain-containing protein [Phascolarctobacterium sp.]|nr:lytic transglycosylase domain-containing protein [Phascolarctobacterium sp.]
MAKKQAVKKTPTPKRKVAPKKKVNVTSSWLSTPKKIFVGVLCLLILSFGAWKVWESDAVQMRYVYMWDYQQDIITYSKKNNVDPFLVAAIIKNESHYDHKAKSPVGAIGLMQIMPETGQWIAKQMGIKDFKTEDLFTSRTNIRMGCWYVGELYHEFQGNMALVMMAYNAGRGQTNIWMKENNWNYDFNHPENIPYPETREYVQRVLQDRDRYYLYYKNKLKK